MNETVVEQAALGWFEAEGYDTAHGPDISPGGNEPLRASYEEVVLEGRLRTALRKVNDHLSEDAIGDAIRVATRPPEPTLEQNNRWFHRLLTDGIDVESRTNDGETRGDKAWLVDYTKPERNDFLVVNQLTIQGASVTRRPDLVVYVNGLPLAVIELKDPTDEQADLWKAFRQVQGYKETIPALFVFNAVLVLSDGDLTRVGSLTAARIALPRGGEVVPLPEPGVGGF